MTHKITLSLVIYDTNIQSALHYVNSHVFDMKDMRLAGKKIINQKNVYNTREEENV